MSQRNRPFDEQRLFEEPAWLRVAPRFERNALQISLQPAFLPSTTNLHCISIMTTTKNAHVVQFNPFSSLVQPPFWHELTRLKIDVLKLSQDSLPIHASYSTGRTITDRETGKEISLGCHLTVGPDAFETDPQ